MHVGLDWLQRGNLWKSTRCPGYLLSWGWCPIGFFQAGPWRGRRLLFWISGSWFWYLFCSFQDPELHYLMVTAAKLSSFTPALTSLTSPSLSTSRSFAKTSPLCQLPSHLCQENVISILQKILNHLCPAWLPLQSTLKWQKFPMTPGPVTIYFCINSEIAGKLRKYQAGYFSATDFFLANHSLLPIDFESVSEDLCEGLKNEKIPDM